VRKDVATKGKTVRVADRFRSSGLQSAISSMSVRYCGLALNAAERNKGGDAKRPHTQTPGIQ